MNGTPPMPRVTLRPISFPGKGSLIELLAKVKEKGCFFLKKKPVMFPRNTLMNIYSSKHSNFVTKKNF